MRTGRKDFLFHARLVPDKRREDRLLPPEAFIDEDDFDQRWRQESFSRWEERLSGLLPEGAASAKARSWGNDHGHGHRIELGKNGERVSHVTVGIDMRDEGGDFLNALLVRASTYNLVLVLSGGALCAPEAEAFAAAIGRRMRAAQ